MIVLLIIIAVGGFIFGAVNIHRTMKPYLDTTPSKKETEEKSRQALKASPEKKESL